MYYYLTTNNGGITHQLIRSRKVLSEQEVNKILDEKFGIEGKEHRTFSIEDMWTDKTVCEV